MIILTIIVIILVLLMGVGLGELGIGFSDGLGWLLVFVALVIVFGVLSWVSGWFKRK